MNVKGYGVLDGGERDIPFDIFKADSVTIKMNVRCVIQRYLHFCVVCCIVSIFFRRKYFPAIFNRTHVYTFSNTTVNYMRKISKQKALAQHNFIDLYISRASCDEFIISNNKMRTHTHKLGNFSNAIRWFVPFFFWWQRIVIIWFDCLHILSNWFLCLCTRSIS